MVKKNSEGKMRMKSASEAKIDWMMKSKNEKIHLIGFVIIEVFLATMIVLIDNGILGTNPDYTLEDAARNIACFGMCLAMFSILMVMTIALNENRKSERKKKFLKPTWKNEDLDILEDEMLQLEARIKKLEERRY